MNFIRFDGNPIIHANLSDRITERDYVNINGPSLIAAPPWLSDPLGRYYLYFAHHEGSHIRLAFADDLSGPWRIYEPGTLQLDQTPFGQHIASPDVQVDAQNQRLIMYYHGCCNRDPAIPWGQYTCAAVSSDGIHFESFTEPLCQSYLRRFDWNGRHYGIAMPGQFYRSADGLSGFEPLEQTIAPGLCRPHPWVARQYTPRHFAVQVRGDVLRLFFSRTGDQPEHILVSDIDLGEDWTRWQPGRPVSLIQPTEPWEGASEAPVASVPGPARQAVCQLRDPAVFTEDGQTYLLYTVAGEQGIAIGQVIDD